MYTTYTTRSIKTVHKLNVRWDLGELLPNAMHQYKELLKKAKKTALSWDNQNDFKMLEDVESTAKTVFDRTHAEQWAINANVHYNSWTNFIKEDFEPVVQAFHDLFSFRYPAACSVGVHTDTTSIIPVGRYPAACCVGASFDVFICNKCGGLLHISVHGMQTEAVRCDCGAFNWNLIKK